MAMSKALSKKVQKRAMKVALRTVGGSQAHLGTMIGVTASMVSQLVTASRPVPVALAIKIEEATGGAVTRADLRPIDFRDLWPEFANGIGQSRTIDEQPVAVAA